MCLFRSSSRKAASVFAPSSRHTQGFLPQLPLVPIVCFLPWCSFFPSHKRLRFHLIYRAFVRLSFVCGSLVGCSTSDCAVLLRSWRTKRSGITREMSLSMRVPNVSPTSDG